MENDQIINGELPKPPESDPLSKKRFSKQDKIIGSVVLVIGMIALLMLLASKSTNNTPPQTIKPETVSPTPDVTLNWKRYLNSYFVVKHPTNIISTDYSENQLEKDTNKTDIKGDFKKIKKVTYEAPTVAAGAILRSDTLTITFWLLENPGFETVDTWYEKYSYYPDSISSELSINELPQEPVRIADMQGKKGFPQSTPYKEAILLQNGQMMLLVIGTFRDDSANQKELFQRVLSTFLFVEQNDNRAAETILDEVTSRFPTWISWQSSKVTTISYYDYSENADTKPKVLSGLFRTGTGTATESATFRIPTSQYLINNKWVDDSNQTVNGITGAQWGYKRQLPSKQQVLQLNYVLKPLNPSEDGTTECPCEVIYEAFLSNPF